MRIAIDTFILNRKFRNQGSYVYAQKLLEQFQESARSGEIQFRLVVSPRNNDAEQFASRLDFELSQSDLMSSTKLWRMGASSFTVGRARADLAYFPAPVNCMFSRLPSVVTIYDATVLKAPSQTFAKRTLERTIIWNAIKSASKILTLSQNSKNDLLQLYGIPEDRIAVVYLGYDKDVFYPFSEESFDRGGSLESTKPYVMHHGVIQPRKNLERLIEAYKLVLAQNPSMDFDLLLVGPVGWSADGVLKAANDVRGRGRVIITGPIPEDRLAGLIRRASLCVIPSLYEGFCLPLLECMACGSPTIAARTSCLPEISGDVLAYFDPYSIDDIASAMTAALCDSELRRGLVERGVQRASEFSWARSARKTLEVLVATSQHAGGN